MGFGIKKIILTVALCAIAIFIVWQVTGPLAVPEPPEILIPDNTTIEKYSRQGYAVRFVEFDKNPLAMVWMGNPELALQNERQVRELMGEQDRVLFVSYVNYETIGLTRRYSIVERDQDNISVLEVVYPVKERYNSGKFFFLLKEKTPQRIVYEKNLVGAQRLPWLTAFMACLCILVAVWAFNCWLGQRAAKRKMIADSGGKAGSK